ncbi:MAG TPA: hypoxanthine phosphoribosyltransferase [Anaerolineae bacterium]|nr:hypoxanthine phosphoribosyltransferase [Anaerolineae bacterium]
MTFQIPPTQTPKKGIPETIPEAYREGLSRLLIDEASLQARIREMGRAIARDYADKNPIFVGVLKGVLFFMADLLRHTPIPLAVDFMAISSYSPESRDHGYVRITKDLDLCIEGRHVIFVEDIIDTGLTLGYLLRLLRERNPASLEVAALFDKPGRRLIDIQPRYLGFHLPDLFVVGYGLDFREQYRNLPFVAVLNPDVIKNQKRQPKR